MPKSKKNAQNNLLARLRQDYPDLTFMSGNRYLFHPPTTIQYVDAAEVLLLLHELGQYRIGQQE